MPPTSTYPYKTGFQKAGRVRTVIMAIEDIGGDILKPDVLARFFMRKKKLIIAGNANMLTISKIKDNRLVPKKILKGARRNAAMSL